MVFKTVYFCLKINYMLVALPAALDVMRKGWWVAIFQIL